MPQHISYLIQPERSCNNEAYIAVLIPSHPKDGLKRTIIRKTWGHALIQDQWPHAKLGKHADIFFLLGRTSNQLEHQSVEQEAHTYADMIIGDFDDTYRNLSIKMLFGLNWIAKNCAETKFLVKIDQDTFVDFPQLMNLLLNNEYKLHNSVLGKLYYSPWVLTSGKWKNDPNEYPFSMFPTYAGGPCYILSTDIIAPIVNMSQYIPYMSLEDVYITGVLLKALGAPKYDLPQLHNFPEEETFCDFIADEKRLLSTTRLSTDQLSELWQTITRGTC
ncbi:hypothetical protein C0Q70_11082 [Pomacea canaliculata]|uniref:Hexosyltransferase n=2 Tax=Pomacea canaliculata TaxID=400727 RepID=A0A2T7P4Y7_POMCA|nr:hypothetical protein C0Q70_11082 [Pomacea canaliculata]